MDKSDRQIVGGFRQQVEDKTNVGVRSLIEIVDDLDEQNSKLENELQVTNELLTDALTEAGMQEGYAHQLEKQLIKVKEVGEPIEKFVEHLESAKADDQIVDATRRLSDRQCHGELGVVSLTYGQLRRLVQALKEIEDGTK